MFNTMKTYQDKNESIRKNMSWTSNSQLVAQGTDPTHQMVLCCQDTIFFCLCLEGQFVRQNILELLNCCLVNRSGPLSTNNQAIAIRNCITVDVPRFV